MPNIISLLNQLQELTTKLEYAKTLEEILKIENEITYVRNLIIEKTL